MTGGIQILSKNHTNIPSFRNMECFFLKKNKDVCLDLPRLVYSWKPQLGAGSLWSLYTPGCSRYGAGSIPSARQNEIQTDEVHTPSHTMPTVSTGNLKQSTMEL